MKRQIVHILKAFVLLCVISSHFQIVASDVTRELEKACHDIIHNSMSSHQSVTRKECEQFFGYQIEAPTLELTRKETQIFRPEPVINVLETLKAGRKLLVPDPGYITVAL